MGVVELVVGDVVFIVDRGDATTEAGTVVGDVVFIVERGDVATEAGTVVDEEVA